MRRLKRTENQDLTRQRLLYAARALFNEHGYVSTSIERIAEAAGFTKGAFYSNFGSKEDIYLAVLAEYGTARLELLIAAIGRSSDLHSAIDATAAWATETSRAGNWSMLILEHQRDRRSAVASRHRQEEIMRSHWLRVGECLCQFVPNISIAPDLIGALVFELAYAPGMSFIDNPTAGDLVRVALTGALRTSSDRAATDVAAASPQTRS